jgi:hypothetical protein
MSMSIEVKVDLQGADNGVGWATVADHTEDLRAIREGGLWLLVAGPSDEHRGSGATLKLAAKRLTLAMGRPTGGTVGTLEVRREDKGDQGRTYAF